MFHAQYKMTGGEEISFQAEADAFKELGFIVHGNIVQNIDVKPNLGGAINAVFNIKWFIKTLIDIVKIRPQLIYANNLWPSYSSSPLAAARLLNIPVLQAVRNYRLVCPSSKLDQLGACVACHNTGNQIRCVFNGCYNNSPQQSAIVFLYSMVNRAITCGWQRHRYLATSQRTKELLVQRNLPSKKISIRPNFKYASAAPSMLVGSGVVFVGRLTREKGISEIISAWSKIANPPVLTIIGDGPLREEIVKATLKNSKIKWLGQQDQDRVTEYLRSSSLAIVPSTWAEPFGRVAIEAMSVGTPVACPAGGTLEEIVGETGIILKNIDPETLSLAFSILENPEALIELRKKSYERFVNNYTTEHALVDLQAHLIAMGI